MLQVAPKGGGTATGDMYQAMQQRMAHFSRPGSAYVINIDTGGANSQGNKVQYVAMFICVRYSLKLVKLKIVLLLVKFITLLYTSPT